MQFQGTLFNYIRLLSYCHTSVIIPPHANVGMCAIGCLLYINAMSLKHQCCTQIINSQKNPQYSNTKILKNSGVYVNGHGLIHAYMRLTNNWLLLILPLFYHIIASKTKTALNHCVYNR